MSKELVTYQTPYVALQANNEVAQIMRANLGDIKMSLSDLPRITIPSGGALYWTIKRSPQEEDTSKDIIGTILDHHGHRTYWDGPLGDGDIRPPDCASEDGTTGYALRYEDGTPKLWAATDGCQSCTTCPLAKWGSKGKGNAIACSKRREVVLVAQGEPFPFIFDFGATSAAVFENFVRSLSLQGKLLTNCEVGFKLVKEKSNAGIEYSLLAPRLVRILEPSESIGIQQYGTAFQRAQLPATVAA